MDHDHLPAPPLPADDRVVVPMAPYRRRRELRSRGHGCWLSCDGTFCLALSAATPRVTA